MRVSLAWEMKREHLPKDYRSGFMSLIKQAMQSANARLFEQYYGKYTLKPFTFSTFFPEIKGEEDGKFNVGKEVRLNVSTSSLELGTYLYNGFLKTRTFPLFQNMSGFENELRLKDISLRKAEQIRSEEVIFKTASPVLVSNKGSSNQYLLPGEEGFAEGLRFAVGECAREFLKRTDDFPFEFSVLEKDGKISVKRRVVWHYNMHRSAFVGAFKIKSDPQILQMIYDVGLGVRRSQGFGMLEVVRQ